MFNGNNSVTHRPPLTTPREVAYSSQHLFYDVGKARRELGLQPAPVEASLERAIRWFRRTGMARASGRASGLRGAAGCRNLDRPTTGDGQRHREEDV